MASSWRVLARSLADRLRRHRRKSRILAIGILIYVAVITIIGGIDVMIGPIRFRSNDTDWLLQLAALAALLDLLLSRTAASTILGVLGDARATLSRAAPALLRWLAAAAALLIVLWVIGRVVTTMPRETPGGDMALLELYTRQATELQALVGPYSRFRWNHPGPSMFYLFRPLYQLSGGRFESLRTSALLLNVGCLLALLAIVRRRAGPALLLPMAVAFAIYLLRVSDVLTSPWNPHLLLLPLALLVVVCAAVLEGDARYGAAVVAIASFLIQTHLSVTPTAAALTAIAAAALLVKGRRLPQPHHWRWINVAVWVGVVMWFLPLAEEVSSPTGNLSQILESFFDDPQPGPASRESSAAFFQMLSGFLLPGFGTAWGGLQLRSVTWSGFAVTAGVLLALPWAAGRVAKATPFVAILGSLLFASSIVALWSVLRIQGDPFDQLLFWVSIIGVLSCGVVAAGGLTALTERMPAVAAWLSPAGQVAAIALLLLVATLGGRQLFDPARHQPTDPTSLRIRNGAAAVAGFLSTERLQRPVVHIAPEVWGDAAGIVLILEKGGTTVTVERDWVFMFGRPREETGDEDAEIVLADSATRQTLAGQASYAVVAEWPELTIFARRRPAPPAT